MNYIKGYRYELYCLARNVMTTICLVYCDTDKDTAYERCEKLNQGSIAELVKEEEKKGEEEVVQIISDSTSTIANNFPLELFEDYTSRMEVPNPAKRWDKPCFQLRTDEELPLEDI